MLTGGAGHGKQRRTKCTNWVCTCVIRFAAAVGVEKETARTGRRSLVVLALEKRRESRFDGLLDRLMTEMFITGAGPGNAMTCLENILAKARSTRSSESVTKVCLGSLPDYTGSGRLYHCWCKDTAQLLTCHITTFLRCDLIRYACGAGDAVFQFFTPSRLGEHRLWFTSAFTLAVFIVFFFCIGEFPQFCLLNSPPLPDPGPCLRDANPCLLAFGPAQMTHWIAPGVRPVALHGVGFGCAPQVRDFMPGVHPWCMLTIELTLSCRGPVPLVSFVACSSQRCCPIQAPACASACAF